MDGRMMKVKQFSEWNVTRLGLIPAQSKLPEKYRMGWEEVKGDAENHSLIRANTGESCGIPYGTANDVMTVLMTLAVTNNEKQIDGKIRTTKEELSKMMPNKGRIGGRNYQGILSDLTSLKATNFTVENRWQTIMEKRRSFAMFSLINSFRIEEVIKIQGEIEKHIYAIDLNELLWQSASSGMTLSLDPQILTALDSPTSRTVYRMLEAYRRNEDDLKEIYNELIIRATEFADAARLLATRPDISQRMLSLTRKGGAFEQLQREGYLKDIDITGRGDNTIIRFRFKDVNSRNIINTRAEKLLVESGVQPSHALKLAEQHSTEAVECAIWLTEQAIKKQQGTPSAVKNPPGFIIKLLTSGDALSKVEAFQTERQNQLRIKERLSNTVESPPPAVPQKTAQEQLSEVLKLKKFQTATIAALKKAVENQTLNTQQIKSLLVAVNPEEAAQKLLSLPT